MRRLGPLPYTNFKVDSLMILRVKLSGLHLSMWLSEGLGAGSVAMPGERFILPWSAALQMDLAGPLGQWTMDGMKRPNTVLIRAFIL